MRELIEKKSAARENGGREAVDGVYRGFRALILDV